jgi:TolA-binding protein
MSDPCDPSRLPATVLWFLPAPPVGGDCSAAAPAAAARTVSGDCDRSVSSQTTVRASNVRHVTPKLDKKKKATRLLSLSSSPPRTVEEMFQQRVLRDRQWDEQQRRRNRQWEREEQLQRVRLRIEQMEERMDRLGRQMQKKSPHVQALVGASEGRHRNSPAHRRDNFGSCCFCSFVFFFRFQAHRRQEAVVGPLDQDEQRIIHAMGEPIETTTNRRETLIKRMFSWGAITAPSRKQFTKEV